MRELKPIDGQVEVVEKRLIKRITFRNFIASIFDAFNIDRGAIFTLKELFRRPGLMTLSYLGLNRYNYVPPFRLLIVTTAFALLAISIIFKNQDNEFVRGLQSTNVDVEVVINALSRFANLLLWMFIPVIAIFTLLFNRKSAYNYTEHLVFNTYLYCISNLTMVLYLLDYLLNLSFLNYFTAPILLFYYVLAYRQFFNKSWLRSSIEILVIAIISSLIYALMGTLILGLIAAFEKFN